MTQLILSPSADTAPPPGGQPVGLEPAFPCHLEDGKSALQPGRSYAARSPGPRHPGQLFLDTPDPRDRTGSAPAGRGLTRTADRRGRGLADPDPDPDRRPRRRSRYKLFKRASEARQRQGVAGFFSGLFVIVRLCGWGWCLFSACRPFAEGCCSVYGYSSAGNCHNRPSHHHPM